MQGGNNTSLSLLGSLVQDFTTTYHLQGKQGISGSSAVIILIIMLYLKQKFSSRKNTIVITNGKLDRKKTNHIVDGIDVIEVGDENFSLHDIFNLKEKSYTGNRLSLLAIIKDFLKVVR